MTSKRTANEVVDAEAAAAVAADSDRHKQEET